MAAGRLRGDDHDRLVGVIFDMVGGWLSDRLGRR